MNPAKVYLAQSDTTAGFLSQNRDRLLHVKRRDSKKPFIISVSSFKNLKEFVRVPKNHRKFIRRVKKTTIVYPNSLAIRVVQDKEHLRFLQKFSWLYTTSSNISGESFDKRRALELADIIVYDKRGFFEDTPSKIYKCGKISKRRLR